MDLNRRAFLTGAMVAGMSISKISGSLLDGNPEARGNGNEGPSDFDFVHLADQHVYDKRSGNEGYRACVESINRLSPRPDLVLMGGDMVFDGCYNTREDYLRWLGQFKTISDELEMPWYPCMGNHDPFGVHPGRKVERDDPDIGKELMKKALNWPRTYYSLDHKGWHFTVLDSIHPVESESGPTYVTRVGEEQLKWLAGDLGAAGVRPKVVVIHVAALYMAPMAEGNMDAPAMCPGMVVEDNRALMTILERHGVQAVLQGHCHHIEEFRYRGVRYITSAAASGAWWAGDWCGDPCGYTVFHCRGEELTWEHRSFPWEPRFDESDEAERENQANYLARVEEQALLLSQERIQNSKLKIQN